MPSWLDGRCHRQQRRLLLRSWRFGEGCGGVAAVAGSAEGAPCWCMENDICAGFSISGPVSFLTFTGPVEVL